MECIVFLEAPGTALTKSFTRNPDGTLDKSAYPLVKNFTSHEVQVSSIEQFATAVIEHAAAGHCLLKGSIKRPLIDESRAGSTDAASQTRWSVFDLDNVPDVPSIEDFIQRVLPAAFHDVDYIVQYSASSGVTQNAGINAHLFFLHENSFMPEAAKLFVTELNLTNALLSAHLELTAAGTALRYRLDRSVCQSDKIIYIAPPLLGPGVPSSLVPEQRISVVKKSKRLVEFDWKTVSPPNAVLAQVQAKVDELRETGGMRRKTARYRTLRGEQILTNPDHAVVTGERSARGYTYLNLNGGDSWGYYYSSENPRYLRNFKGEPTVVLADFLPEYWAQIQDRFAGSDRMRPFAFRHRPTDQVWNGVYDPINDRIIELAPTTRNALPDFFTQYNEEVPAVLHDWRLEFNPQTAIQIDFDKQFCNKWEPTQYMKLAQKMPGASTPPTIRRVLTHVLGGDETCYAHFLNWLAFVFQKREKTGTAWVIHGTQGTGKGILYSHILVPLFGEKYSVQKQISSLDDQFNAELETALIYNFDEGQLGSAEKTKRAYSRFKNMITETTASIRAMRANAIQAVNYTNFIISSNDYDAMGIEEGDRRFNVAPRQEEKIKITPSDIEAIRDELMEFATFLASIEVNEQQARTAMSNDAKNQMREAGQDWLEQMCSSLIDGNMDYFMHNYESRPPTGDDMMVWSAYNEVMKCFVLGPKEQVVSTGDIRTLYTYLSGNIMAAGKFGRMLKHKNVLVKPIHCAVQNKTVRGVKVEWKNQEQWTTAFPVRVSQAQAA